MDRTAGALDVADVLYLEPAASAAVDPNELATQAAGLAVRVEPDIDSAVAAAGESDVDCLVVEESDIDETLSSRLGDVDVPVVVVGDPGASFADAQAVADSVSPAFGDDLEAVLAARVRGAVRRRAPGSGSDGGDGDPTVDRDQAVDRTRSEEHVVDQLFRVSDAGVAIYDDAGEITLANERFEELLGIEGSATGTRVWECHPDLSASESDLGERADEGAVHRVELNTEPLGATSVEVALSTVATDGETVGVATCRDVSKRIEYRRDQQVHEGLFDQFPGYLFVKDEDARYVYVSDWFDDGEEVIGKTDPEIYGPLGERYYADDMRVIQRGEHIIDKLEHTPGTDYFRLTSKVPWRAPDGEIQGLIGVSRDVTEQKRYERRLEEQNERLQTLSSVLSHDIRTPLNIATGRLERVSDDVDEQIVTDVDGTLAEMSELLDAILSMVEYGHWVEEKESVTLADLVGPSWDEVAGEGDTLECDPDLEILGDPDLLAKLFEQLLENAVEHGGPDVSVQIAPTDDTYGFYVEDDGPGLPEDDPEQVFDPGYTTEDDRTGFGLTVVEAIAEAHGWQIHLVEPDHSTGTRFVFRGIEFPEDYWE